jgi:hypothetical protein
MISKKTPYIEWLLKEADRDPIELKSLLVHEVYVAKNKQAMDLLDLADSNRFNMDTFSKTTDLLLSL